MPRTKRQMRKDNSENMKPNKRKIINNMVDSYMKDLENQVELNKEQSQAEVNRMLIDFETQLTEIKLKFPRKAMYKTLTELKDLPVEFMYDTTKCNNTTLNSTKKNRILNVSPSSSVNSKVLLKKGKTRASRSLSRDKSTAASSTYVTPATKLKSKETFGMITPKVMPNTPQVLLRRPKQGEMAISMQGSPLMVGGVITDDTANVNIPLKDGSLLSIQPQRGLRMSQFPLLDENTQRQIETLRDNLIKVCELSGR